MQKIVTKKMALLMLMILSIFSSGSVFTAVYQYGDMAPRGATDGALDITDVLILERIIQGEITPTAEELIIGDLAPLNNSNGVLNIADVLILQRAILGQITLGTVNIAPPAPTLDAVASPTNENPYLISGAAQPGAEVSVYVNDIEKGTIAADAVTGAFSVTVALQEGNNTIYATANDGVDVSQQSSPVIVEFQYIDGGTLSGNIGDQTLSANTKYTVTGNISVSGGQILTIENGSKIVFAPNTGLLASGWDGSNGTVQVNGTSELPVVFTSNSTTPSAGDWKGIEIGMYVSTNISHAVIEYAENGIFFNRTNVNSTYDFGGTVSNSVIRNNINGINVYMYARPQILDSQIYANQNGLYVHHDSASFRWGKAYPVINNNEIHSNNVWNYLTEDMRDIDIDPVLMVLDATGNWWGTSDPVLIAASIYDTSDPDGYGASSSRPIVDFSDFLDAPGGTGQGQVMPANISTSVTYNSGIVHVVGDVKVAYGGALTINAGVEVRVSGNSIIQASGLNVTTPAVVQVAGTLANPVTFTSRQTTPMPGDWKGIECGQYSSCSISFAVIEYAVDGVFFNYNNNMQTGLAATVENTVIRYNTNGIHVYNYSAPQITANQLYENTRALYVHHNTLDSSFGGAYPVVTGNEFFDNHQWNYFTENMRSRTPTPMKVDATGNWWGTSDPLAIAEKIYDAFDPNDYDPTGFRPIVDFGHALDSAGGAAMQVYVNETIDSNLILSGNVYVVGELSVATGFSLSLSSSTEVMFFEGASLTVNGDISVAADPNNPVLFIPVEPTASRSYWNGVRISSSSLIADIDGCFISNASRAFEFDNASGSISNCVITNNDVGVYIFDNNPSLDSVVSLTGNLIVDNNTGIYLTGGGGMNVTILQNDIYENDIYNVWLQSVSDISGISFSQNWWDTTDPAAIQSTFNYYSTNQISLPSIATVNNMESGISSISLDNYYISPQSSTGINDTVTVTANFAGVSTWSFEVQNAGGSTVYSQTGSGSLLNATWNGQSNGGVPQADGIYRILVKIGNRTVYVSSVIIDNTAPASDLDDALNGQTYDVVQLALRGTANDINIQSYTIEVANTYAPGPADYQTVYTGAQNLTTHNLYTWVVNDTTNNIVEPSGEKTLRLTVTDKAGNTSIDTITLYLSHISVSNVSFSPGVITPASGGQLSVNFHLGLPADVTLQIYKEGTTDLVASRQENHPVAGSKTMIWDGKDDAGNYVPDEAYRFEILADSGSTSSLYAVRGGDAIQNPPGFSNFSTFDTHKNIYLKTNVSITDSMRLTSNAIQNSGTFINGGVNIVSKALLPGDYTILWDGRDIDGKIVEGLVVLGNGMRYIEQNAVFVQGNSPQLIGIYPAPDIEIKSNPYTVVHSYDQASTVRFTVDQDVIATVHLIKPCMHTDLECSADFDGPGAITLLDNVSLAGGQANVHSFEWRGYDVAQATPDTNNIQVSDDGTYTYIIKAVSVASGVTSYYRGSLGLYQ